MLLNKPIGKEERLTFFLNISVTHKNTKISTNGMGQCH